MIDPSRCPILGQRAVAIDTIRAAWETGSGCWAGERQPSARIKAAKRQMVDPGAIGIIDEVASGEQAFISNKAEHHESTDY